MNYGFSNPIPFKERLEYLMKKDGINPSEKGAESILSNKMYENGIIKYNDQTGDETAKAKQRDNTRNVISKHLKLDSAENLSGIWILRYCKYFKCSADYLLRGIDLPTHIITDVSNATGLSQEAITSLTNLKGLNSDKYFPGSQDNKFDIINLILSDNHEKESLSSLLDMITGFCRFNISGDNDRMYTVDKNGITNFQYTPSISGKGGSYNPLKAHFHLHDMESMYYLKIWDSIKELKELYQKNKKTPDTN